VDFAEVVFQTLHFHPATVRRDHFPGREIVQCRAPEHGFLAAGIHRDVAAYAGRIGRRGVNGKHQSASLGGFHHAARDNPGAAVDRGIGT